MKMRLPLIAAAAAATVVLLTGCGGGGAGVPTDSPASIDTSAPSTSPASTTPPADPSAIRMAGDCTEAEMQDAQPTVYTVYTGDSTNPVTIRYTAFNHDGTNPTETITAVGPVINILGYACTEAAGSATWVLTAHHSNVGSIACVLDFGGLLVNSKSDGQEDPNVTVDCSGNPGE